MHTSTSHNKKKELHLCIIRHTHNHLKKRFIDAIQTTSQLSILKIVSLQRSSDHYFRNFKRFYRKSDKIIYWKLLKCGNGEATLLLLEDQNPVYAIRQTSSWTATVNTNVFDLKMRLRASVWWGHTIHMTNSIHEFNKDITLLAGKQWLSLVHNPKDALSSFPDVIYDPVGTQQRSSLRLFFDILAYHTPYVVMRNYYELPHKATYGPHGDIDILVESKEDAELLLNWDLVFKANRRVHYKKWFNQGDAFFDIRTISDWYMDPFRSKQIIQSPSTHNSIYIPNNEYHLYSLMYHALIHKKKLSKEYILQIWKLATLCNINTPIRTASDIISLLGKYMKKHWYTITEPDDYSVYYNSEYVKSLAISQDITSPKLSIHRRIFSIPLVWIVSKHIFTYISIRIDTWENLVIRLRHILIRRKSSITKNEQKNQPNISMK